MQNILLEFGIDCKKMGKARTNSCKTFPRRAKVRKLCEELEQGWLKRMGCVARN